MCTAIAFSQNADFFMRTLDLEHRYAEEAVICGQSFALPFRHTQKALSHYAILGIATVIDSYPLYYDAINENGLAMAGLNFVGNARFTPYNKNKINLAGFELIPYVLGKCASVQEARRALSQINLVATPFNDSTPLSELHYFITDGKSSITVEPTDAGLEIHDNPFGVLTNNPKFDFHRENVNNYLNVTAEEPTNRFSSNLQIDKYSKGMGALGLPGDNSSASRFIRSAFTSQNAKRQSNEDEEIAQAFHVIESVFQVEGCVKGSAGLEKTQYTIAANLNTGTYYYKTYTRSQITAVRLTKENMKAPLLERHPLRFDDSILYEN